MQGRCFMCLWSVLSIKNNQPSSLGVLLAENEVDRPLTFLLPGGGTVRLSKIQNQYIYSGRNADVVMGGSEPTEAIADATMILREGNTVLVAKMMQQPLSKLAEDVFTVPPTFLKVGNYVRRPRG